MKKVIYSITKLGKVENTKVTNDNREAFQQMMKDSDKKAWDFVLVFMYDTAGNEISSNALAMTPMMTGSGTISGKLEFRAYSGNSNNPGRIISVSEMAKAKYVAKCVATTPGYEPSDPAIQKFSVSGQLNFPLVCYETEGTKMTIGPCDFYVEDALWGYGAPNKVEVTIKKDGQVYKTLTYDDFSHTTAYKGPNTIYTFYNLKQEVELEAGTTASDYEITAIAYGDDKTTFDSVAAPAKEGFPPTPGYWPFTPGRKVGWNDFWESWAAENGIANTYNWDDNCADSMNG